jgi:peroxidase
MNKGINFSYEYFMHMQVTEHLFESGNSGQGLDLVALNIQRGRDHGVAPYTRWRMWCGLPPVSKFSDLALDMDNGTLERIASVYE